MLERARRNADHSPIASTICRRQLIDFAQGYESMALAAE
jgi:hypothetical protein